MPWEMDEIDLRFPWQATIRQMNGVLLTRRFRIEREYRENELQIEWENGESAKRVFGVFEKQMVLNWIKKSKNE